MKIVHYSTGVPGVQPAAVAPAAAVPIVTPSDPQAERRAEEREKALKHSLEVFQAEIGTLRDELQRLSAAHAKDDALLQQNARTIQALSEEIAVLRKTVIEVQKPKTSPPPIQKAEPAEEIKLIEVKPVLTQPEPRPAAVTSFPVISEKPLPEPKPKPVVDPIPAAASTPVPIPIEAPLPAGQAGAPAPKPEPKPAPVLEVKPEPSREWLDALSKPVPGAAEKPPKDIDLPSVKNKEKVALLSKLWDYLNHVAVEIPLRKSDRDE